LSFLTIPISQHGIPGKGSVLDGFKRFFNDLLKG
jgi:hypothetical protein